MKLVHMVPGFALALLAAPVAAQQHGATNGNLIGKVETVYVREGRGVYFEKKLMRRTEGRELWADVRLPRPASGAASSELARLPANAAIETGDLVETKIVDPMPQNRELFAVNQVLKVVAKHDTLPAMLFGLSEPSPARDFPAEALACIPAGTRVAVVAPAFGRDGAFDRF